jgi:cbb3-type cytochrome oxidase subunit 3
MFKQFVDQVAGADQYLIASLLIFFIFFVVISLLLIKMNKTHIAYMSKLPLQDAKDGYNKNSI